MQKIDIKYLLWSDTYNLRILICQLTWVFTAARMNKPWLSKRMLYLLSWPHSNIPLTSSPHPMTNGRQNLFDHVVGPNLDIRRVSYAPIRISIDWKEKNAINNQPDQHRQSNKHNCEHITINLVWESRIGLAVAVGLGLGDGEGKNVRFLLSLFIYDNNCCLGACTRVRILVEYIMYTYCST